MAETTTQREIQEARKKKDQRKPQDSFPMRNGLAVAPGGQSQRGQEAQGGLDPLQEAMRAGGKLGPAALKGLMGMGGGPTQADIQGSDPQAFAQQRAGERGDFSAAMPGATAGLTGSNLWGSGGALAPNLPNFNVAAPDVSFSMMPQQVGDLGVSGAGATGAAAEGAAGAGAGGWGSLGAGLIGPGVGYLTSMLTRGMDPVAGGLINAGAGVAGGIAGGAALGALGGVGAGGAAGAAAAGSAAGSGALAGAGAGAAAAGSAALVAAPIAAGIIMQSILAAKDTGDAVRDMKIRLRNIQSQFPAEYEQIVKAGQDAMGIDIQHMKPEELGPALKRFNDLQHGFQEGGWESYQKGGGTTTSGGSAGQDVTVNLPGIQSALNNLNPQWQNIDRARAALQDRMFASGMSQEDVAKATGRILNPVDFMSPQAREWLFPTKDAQGNPYAGPTFDYSQEGGPRQTAAGNMPTPESYTDFGRFAGLAPGPDTNAYYLQPDQPGRTPGMPETGFLGTPMGTANRAAYDELMANWQKGYSLQNTLAQLETAHGDPNNPFTQAFGQGQGGPSGEAGKAIGRLQPRNVVTGLQALPRPEADARTEAAFGMRKPLTSGNPASQDASQAPAPPVPGTSAAEPPAFGNNPKGGGFAVAPGGNIGTGGLVTPAPFGYAPTRGSRGGL